MRKKVCVIGGANIDICGTPFHKLINHDSNPGYSHFSFGGVGRNIAENLTLFKNDVSMITAIGNDIYGEMLKNSFNTLQIDISHSLFVDNENSSSYIYLTDEKGEMQYAVSDMKILDKISVNYLKDCMPYINFHDACVIDTNFSSEIIKFLLNQIRIPIYIDPVSTQKALRLKNILTNVHMIKPNIIEAETITGIKILENNDLIKASEILMNNGVEKVFISLNKQGLFYRDAFSYGIVPSMVKEIRNTTGAGDTLMAALLWADINNYDIKTSAIIGMEAAAICVADENSVSHNINVNKILSQLNKKDI